MPQKTGNQKNLFIIGIFLISGIFFILTYGYITNEKISEDDAIRIALHDPQMLKLINGSTFTISDVGTANIGAGDSGSQQEVYYISFVKSGEKSKQIIVFVTYGGKVISVETQYSAIAPDNLTNLSAIANPGKNETVIIPGNSSPIIPIPSEIPR
ncbi:MAG: hypothetical protein WAU64_06060 [Methanoregula sp.]|uniref:hypothetical protein n=1 Tax=Methanoregula sp. TaxID=2052170 RepID=UPI003BAFF25C